MVKVVVVVGDCEGGKGQCDCFSYFYYESHFPYFQVVCFPKKNIFQKLTNQTRENKTYFQKIFSSIPNTPLIFIIFFYLQFIYHLQQGRSWPVF